MNDREGKSVDALSLEKMPKMLPLAFSVLLLLSLFFYLGSIYGSDGTARGIEDAVAGTGLKVSDCSQAQGTLARIVPTQFKSCNLSLQDLTPCTDPLRWWKYDRNRMAFRERHCPPLAERVDCLIPPPEGYRIPILWPRSRDECWYRNVPYNWINEIKANQRWMQKEGEKFFFPGGGTMFPNGVDEYLNQMEELLPQMKDGTIRTALDTGCGVASWGGYLLERGILTMSLAPRDNHEAQVQFALERGIPAMLGVISTQRLPYPANAFDMAHCSRCLIPWTDHGGVNLLEVDRVIRPGGFWVLSGPPVNYKVHWKGWGSSEEKQRSNMEKLQDLLHRMCYTQYAMKGDIAIWQKPLDDTCYNNRAEGVIPPVCDDSIDPDAAWYVPVRPCIVKKGFDFQRLGVGQTARWPARLSEAPERAKLFSGGSLGGFKKDTKLWHNIVNYYKSILPELKTKKIRNVMDMNTKYGGFAAALINDPVWVMNVVSSYAANSLGVIYDRGLIGTVNDWCEAFSTYPRTYDLLHVDGLFTAESHRCDMKFVLLEMDRILRPEAHVIVRDSTKFIDDVSSFGEAIRWKCSKHLTEKADDDTERVLICQKTFWRSSDDKSS